MNIQQAAVIFLDDNDEFSYDDVCTRVIVNTLLESIEIAQPEHREFLVATCMYYMTYTDCKQHVEEGTFTQDELDKFWEETVE